MATTVRREAGYDTHAHHVLMFGWLQPDRYCACMRLPGSAQIAVVDGQDFRRSVAPKVKFAGVRPVG